MISYHCYIADKSFLGKNSPFIFSAVRSKNLKIKVSHDEESGNGWGLWGLGRIECGHGWGMWRREREYRRMDEGA